MPAGDLNQPGRHQDGDQHQPRHHGRPQVHPGQALVPVALHRPRTISPRPAASRNRPKPAMIASGTAPAPGWPPSQLATRITPQPKSPMPLLRTRQSVRDRISMNSARHPRIVGIVRVVHPLEHESRSVTIGGHGRGARSACSARWAGEGWLRWRPRGPGRSARRSGLVAATRAAHPDGVICAGTVLRSPRPRRRLARLGALRWPDPGPWGATCSAQ